MSSRARIQPSFNTADLLSLAAIAAVGLASLTSLNGCDQKSRSDELLASATMPSEDAARAPLPGNGAPSPAAAGASATASGPPRTVPPRPLPKGKWGPIQVTAPLEIQQKALAYTYAMATPDPTDPAVDKDFLAQLKKKLEGAAPPGATVSSTQGDRKIEIELKEGCTEKTPFNLTAQRAGSPLARLAQAGIFVVQCHDAKWKCFQSTRDTDDVICMVAPRH